MDSTSNRQMLQIGKDLWLTQRLKDSIIAYVENTFARHLEHFAELGLAQIEEKISQPFANKNFFTPQIHAEGV